jgi:glycyl-tRNA synthetase
MSTNEGLMEKIVSLAKRRGFVFQGSELYGGLQGTWDYGPLGVLMKNNIKAAWWKKNVQERPDMVGLDAAILMNRKVWEASGHTKFMFDDLVECKACHRRFRKDKVGPECPDCGGEFSDAKPFNLMLETMLGPVANDDAKTFLRPETAQGIFVDYPLIQETSRKKLPFGVAQVGKSFRNEITPGNFVFRVREFEQMEIEYFCRPEEGMAKYEEWRQSRLKWWKDLGIKDENIRFYEYKKDELAHYSAGTTDVQFAFPFGKEGWDELEGIANRTDFDLSAHAKASGQEIAYFDEETKKKIVPHVIEPSAGVDRAFLAFMLNGYEEISGGRTTTTESIKETETVLHLHPAIAPFKAAVLPLSKKPELSVPAKELAARLRSRWMIDYDEVASIGKRYRREDEIGTPFCITYDFDSLEDKKVTVRDRDTMKQDRVSLDELEAYLDEKLRY